MSRAATFQFEASVSLADAERTLHLAMFAVEGLVGRARVCIGARYWIDPDRCEIAIDTQSRIGRMISRVFTGLLLRQHGDGAFFISHRDVQPDGMAERSLPK